MDLFLESSIVWEDKLVSHEDVIKQLAADTVKSDTMLGLHLGYSSGFTCGSFCSNAVIDLKVINC